MMVPEADEDVPMFAPQLLDGPVPASGRLRSSGLDKPGLAVELNRDIPLHRQ